MALSNFSEDLKFSSVKDAVGALSHLPISLMMSKIELMVSEISESLDKEVCFVVRGYDVTIDRTRMYAAQDALLHLPGNKPENRI